MSALIPLLGDKKVFHTEDGSISYYNLTYGESYRAKSIGAYTESLYKFVLSSGLLEKVIYKNIRILDICFGLGYNIAVTLDEILKIKNHMPLEIVSIEKDTHLINMVLDNYFMWPTKGFSLLRDILKYGKKDDINITLVIDDAVRALDYINYSFDIIYFDPFSKSKNPEMWNKSLYAKLYSLLNNDGIVVTYACSRSIRNEFNSVGFKYKEMDNLPKNIQKGTIFIK